MRIRHLGPLTSLSRLARPFACSLAFLLTAGSAGAQLGPTGTQFWSQDSPGIGVGLEAGAAMGQAVAAGDFDCDGFDDLAIGMPFEDLVQGDDAGRVLVLQGGPDGITAEGDLTWGQNSPVIDDQAEPDDRFGSVLAAGDFDDDGCDDLAVGVPFEDVDGVLNAGAVNVIYGGPGGLSGDGDQFLHQDLGDLTTALETGDLFGGALAVGDLDNDGVDDLVVGVPGENVSTVENGGMVHVLYGSIDGLETLGTTSLRRGIELPGPAQVGENLGASLAVGDFVGFLGDELAVGAPRRDVAGHDQAGAVVLISDVDGLILDSLWHQDSTDVPGAAEDFDRFGSALAAGDFDGDGFDELAVGVPDEDREAPPVGSIGAVNVLNFVSGEHQLWTQDDFPPEAEGLNERFGFALAAGDFDADGVDDLVAAAPLEDLGPFNMAGLVHVIPGERGTGLVAAGAQIWIQTIDPSEDGDEFGSALAVGRFAGRGAVDLAIGVPGETIGSAEGTGGVNLLYSESLFRDGFESGDTSAWSADGP
ncbi:MAG: FG-GAP repeat protein [Acidobacteriota bacterium]